MTIDKEREIIQRILYDRHRELIDTIAMPEKVYYISRDIHERRNTRIVGLRVIRTSIEIQKIELTRWNIEEDLKQYLHNLIYWLEHSVLQMKDLCIEATPDRNDGTLTFSGNEVYFSIQDAQKAI